jgi:hypothetical protein
MHYSRLGQHGHEFTPESHADFNYTVRKEASNLEEFARIAIELISTKYFVLFQT